MIAAWWLQYGEFVELRLYADWSAFEADRREVDEVFTSFSVMLAVPVVLC